MTFITDYAFTEEQNGHFLRQILLFISKNKISPTPLNYAICYEYISGSNSRLISAVDRLIKEKNTIDNESAFILYKKYICDITFESFDTINQQLQSLISHTRDTLAETSQKASDVGVNLEEQAASIASATNTEDITHVIADIVAETKGLANVSKTLKSDLDSANMEMEQLRLELAQVREAADTDALTGLLNRGTFDRSLNSLLEQPDRSEACLSMLDLDYFKKINDNFGHQVGDSVLKFTAKILKKYAEPHHLAIRYGGEELAIIMPNTTLKKASEISEKIRSSLENSNLKKRNSNESIGKVTVSIGISSLKSNDTVEDFIMRADNALYKAKETGRNRVITEAL
jgi:diguanylate cyclase